MHQEDYDYEMAKMNTRKNNFYVITGGPGVGKTTLIDALKSKGYSFCFCVLIIVIF